MDNSPQANMALYQSNKARDAVAVLTDQLVKAERRIEALEATVIRLQENDRRLADAVRNLQAERR
jgi:hypothetical protein